MAQDLGVVAERVKVDHLLIEAGVDVRRSARPARTPMMRGMENSWKILVRRAAWYKTLPPEFLDYRPLPSHNVGQDAPLTGQR